MVGSAAAALTGLQFVVMAFVADLPVRRSAPAVDAFGTPTIVHFGTALLLSALVRAPWQAITPPVILWAAIGLCGVIYSLNIIRRMRSQGAYEPQFEDWLFHVVLPVAAYAILVLSAFAALSYTRESLFGVGAAALLLLFTGIHNAWDAVFYHVFFGKRGTDDDSR